MVFHTLSEWLFSYYGATILPILVAIQLELPPSSTEKVNLSCVFNLQLKEFVWKMVGTYLNLIGFCPMDIQQEMLVDNRAYFHCLVTWELLLLAISFQKLVYIILRIFQYACLHGDLSSS